MTWKIVPTLVSDTGILFHLMGYWGQTCWIFEGKVSLARGAQSVRMTMYPNGKWKAAWVGRDEAVSESDAQILRAEIVNWAYTLPYLENSLFGISKDDLCNLWLDAKPENRLREA